MCQATAYLDGEKVMEDASWIGWSTTRSTPQPIELPAYAPILDSAMCVLCGKSAMESRARLVDGRPACLACASAATFGLDGSSIGVA